MKLHAIPKNNSPLTVRLELSPSRSEMAGSFELVNYHVTLIDVVTGSQLVDVCNTEGEDYRFGFNGGEKDNELKGNGNSLDLGLRMYDTRLGRMTKVDPRTAEYPWQTPYAYHRNSPVWKLDYLGGGDDWVQDDKTKQVSWDKNANDQASTKKGQTYLGKTLNFSFTSYIDKKLWDVPKYKTLGFDPSGDKLISNISFTGKENDDGELTSIKVSMKTRPGPTPIGTARMYYPGKGVVIIFLL